MIYNDLTMRMKSVWIIILLCVTWSVAPARGESPYPTPPTQPETGPGGKDYPHAEVTHSRHLDGNERYWLFEPAEPKPASAPVILFMHGWAQTNPRAYGAWIEHLVRRGNIVIYPKYQANVLVATSQFMPAIAVSIEDALRVLSEEGHVQPMLDKVAVVGHSMGGLLAANYAAAASQLGLPQPRAVMCIQPGATTMLPLEDLSQIPQGTLLLSVVTDRDEIVGDADGITVYQCAAQIDPADKDYITIYSDLHSRPSLLADHAAPIALDDKYDALIMEGKIDKVLMHIWYEHPPDALDYYGFWKLFDGLTDAAFFNQHRDHALGDTPAQRFMGEWSDGTPVVELRVTDEPAY